MTLLAGSVSKSEKMDLMFDLYDRNRNGRISRAEMSEFMQSDCDATGDDGRGDAPSRA